MAKITVEAFTEWANQNCTSIEAQDGAEFAKVMMADVLEHMMDVGRCEEVGKLAAAEPDFEKVKTEIMGRIGISPDAAADLTNEFGGENETKGTSGKPKGKRKTNLPRRAANKVIAETAAQLGTTTYGAVATIIAQQGAVIGYVTPTDARIDIVKKTTKVGDTDRSETRFMARMSGPSGCKAFLVAVPSKALEQIEAKIEGQIDENSLDVNAAQDASQPYVLKAYPTDTFVSVFLTSIAIGSIREADELYTPYVMKRRSGKETTVMSLPDLNAVTAAIQEDEAIVAGRNALYTTTSYKKDAHGFQTPLTKVRHTFRTKLVTPDNYISARVFQTIPIQATYTPEECETYTAAYLAKFLSRQFKGGYLIDTVPTDETNITFATAPNGTSEIANNRFFTTNADDSYWATTQVPHWFEREADGNPKMVSLIGQGLVLKEAAQTKKGTTQVRLKYKELRGDAGVDNYTLEPQGRHAKIFAAAAHYGLTDMLNYQFMEALFQTTFGMKDKKAGKAREKATPNPRGRYAFGISAATTSEGYKAALQRALQGAKGE